MVQNVYAIKKGMTQAWDQSGKRLSVTKCSIQPMAVVAVREVSVKSQAGDNSVQTKQQLQLGVGEKNINRVAKPLRQTLVKQGFSYGVSQIVSVYPQENSQLPEAGTKIQMNDVLAVGDVVQVQGLSKGKGFTGVVKRHGFAGGPKTHGQSDRHRAPGSIGQRTTPGRVHKNKRMAGHSGNEKITVSNLVVLHLDPNSGEVWLSGPIPGSVNSLVKISKTGNSKTISLDEKASGIVKSTQPEVKVESQEAQSTMEESSIQADETESTEQSESTNISEQSEQKQA